jgi:hypothetical protein
MLRKKTSRNLGRRICAYKNGIISFLKLICTSSNP